MSANSVIKINKFAITFLKKVKSLPRYQHLRYPSPEQSGKCRSTWQVYFTIDVRNWKFSLLLFHACRCQRWPTLSSPVSSADDVPETVSVESSELWRGLGLWLCYKVIPVESVTIMYQSDGPLLNKELSQPNLRIEEIGHLNTSFLVHGIRRLDEVW